MSNLDTIIDFGSKNLRLGVFDQSSEKIYSSNIKINDALEKCLSKFVEFRNFHLKVSCNYLKDTK